ncbi:MAG: histidinol-phosphate transaminase [Candidatus Altiarchaeota archaeon]
MERFRHTKEHLVVDRTSPAPVLDVKIKEKESKRVLGEPASFIRQHVKDNPFAYIPGAKAEVNCDTPYDVMFSQLSPFGPLASNEMPYPPSNHVQEMFKRTAPFMGQYVPVVRPLEQKIARYIGVQEENVLASNGGESIIRLMVNAFEGPIVYTSPGFVKYPVEAGQAGVEQHGVQLNDNFSVPVDEVVKTAEEKDAGLILIDSPNNPTGKALGEKDLRKILDTGRPVLIDEAYFEFKGKRKPDGIYDEKAGFDASKLLNEYKNLFVLRSMSKVHAMAGLRLGYLLGDPVTLNYLRGQNLTFPITTPSFFTALAAFDEENLTHMRENVGKVVDERKRIHTELNKIEGVEAIDSQTNFLLVETTKLGVSPGELFKRMEQEDIYIRPMPEFKGKKGRSFSRITIGTPEMNNKVLEILREMSDQRSSGR